MPYEVRKSDDRWCVYNTETDEKKACHDTEEEAERQCKLLHMIEQGEEPSGD